MPPTILIHESLKGYSELVFIITLCNSLKKDGYLLAVYLIFNH